MIHSLKAAWTSLVSPVAERRAQVAALCFRETRAGKQVLLVTSRDTRRWIIPKGWPIKGLDGAGSALQEAWEEAGVRRAVITKSPIGTYDYDKRMGDGTALPVKATVYLAEVSDLADDFPEAHERTRKWVTPAEAATLVAEPELRAIFRTL